MVRWAEDLTAKVFAVCGVVVRWSPFLGASLADAVVSRGGRMSRGVDESVDYLVVGSKVKKGQADAVRRAEELRGRGAKIELLDEGKLMHLLRPDLRGARMFFAGGFERADPGVPDSQPPFLARAVGAEVVDVLDETVDYVVLGPKRALGKAAAEKKVIELLRGGHVHVLHEPTFFDVMRDQLPPEKQSGLSALLIELNAVLEPKRLRRSLDMLKRESFALYADASAERLVGVVRSQTTDGVYSNVLYADGRYDCCSQDLEECMGLQGTVCKHLMVLVLGLAQAGVVDVPTLAAWAGKASKRRGPVPNRDVLADTFLRYKSAQAGEIDWRPTETLPEDFYAF